LGLCLKASALSNRPNAVRQEDMDIIEFWIHLIFCHIIYRQLFLRRTKIQHNGISLVAVFFLRLCNGNAKLQRRLHGNGQQIGTVFVGVFSRVDWKHNNKPHYAQTRRIHVSLACVFLIGNCYVRNLSVGGGYMQSYIRPEQTEQYRLHDRQSKIITETKSAKHLFCGFFMRFYGRIVISTKRAKRVRGEI